MAPKLPMQSIDPALAVSKFVSSQPRTSQEDPRVIAERKRQQELEKKKQAQKAVSTVITKGITGGTGIQAPVVPNVIKTPVQQTVRSTELPKPAPVPTPTTLPNGQPIIAGNVSPQSLKGDPFSDLYSDLKKGMPATEVANLYPEYKGVDPKVLEQLSIDIKNGMPSSEIARLYPELTQQPQEDKSILDKIGDQAVNVASGLSTSLLKAGRVAAAPIQYAGEKLGQGIDYLAGTDYQKTSPFKIAGQGMVDQNTISNEQIRSQFAGDPNSFAQKAGEFAGDIGISSLATAATAGLASSALGGTAVATQAANIASKYPRLATAAKLFAQGGLDSNYYMLQSEGSTNPVDTVLGGGINVALGGLGNVAKAGSKALANKLQLSGLINPKKLEYVQTALRETGDQVDNVTKWMDERGIAGGKSKIINKLDDAAKMTRSAVIEAGKKADEIATPIQDKSIKGALEYLTDAVSGSKSPKTQAVYDDLVSLLKKHDEIGLLPSEIQRVKDKIDDIASLYTQAGDVKAGVAKQDLANLRSDIRKILEDEVSKYTGIDVGKLNRDTAVAKQLAIGIKIKDNADSIRELLSPFASPALGGVAGFIGGDGDRKSVLKGLALGSVAGNTAVKSAAAQGIKNLIAKKTAGEVVRRTGTQSARDLITNKDKGKK